ncbi:MAG: SURF1 family protein [Aquabacterium sp.]|nr:SURF1 family protein [Aquabacterium sp.]
MLTDGPSAPTAVPSTASRRRRLLVLVVAVLAALATARLGWWQLDRAQQKLDLQARITARGSLAPLPQADLPRTIAAAADQHYRPVQLRGRWLQQHTLYLDNRQMNARQGFFVVTPLLLGPGDAVLVQRGWMPRDFNDRARLQPLPDQPGEVLVTGRLAPPPSKLLDLAGAEQGPIRQNLDLVALSAEMGLGLRPLSVQQTRPTERLPADGQPGIAPSDDRLLRAWPAVALDVGKHHGYAFQWFSLSALVIGLTLWFQFLRPRLRSGPGSPVPFRPAE